MDKKLSLLVSLIVIPLSFECSVVICYFCTSLTLLEDILVTHPLFIQSERKTFGVSFAFLCVFLFFFFAIHFIIFSDIWFRVWQNWKLAYFLIKYLPWLKKLLWVNDNLIFERSLCFDLLPFKGYLRLRNG